jgi:2-polyprenyl-3-methyl-5-hydroxy-6-metoxy-1,4-benzoquinol methylase
MHISVPPSALQPHPDAMIDAAERADISEPDQPREPVSEQQARHPYAIECSHPAERLLPMFSTGDYITGERFVVGYCRDCKLHVTSPAPSEGELERYYPSSYYGSGRRFNPIVEWLLNNLYSYRARHIEQRQKPGKVLDIGCGRGLLLNKLRERGWQPQGTELSEEAAAYARERLNLPVSTQALQDLNFPAEEFDLVILWHVLEHVHAPRAMLAEVSRILKPGGVLLVAVPNFGSWEARWSGPGWFHLDVPRHLTHFTPRTLRSALEQAGLSLLSTNFFSTEYDFYSFVQSAQNRIGFRHNYLYNLLRTRSAKVISAKGEAEKVGRTETALALATAAPLALASFFTTPLLAALGKGATIAAYARKPERKASSLLDRS